MLSCHFASRFGLKRMVAFFKACDLKLLETKTVLTLKKFSGHHGLLVNNYHMTVVQFISDIFVFS